MYKTVVYNRTNWLKTAHLFSDLQQLQMHFCD